MSYRRRTKQGEQPEQNDPEHRQPEQKGLTRTDALFENYKPGYYKFGDNTHKEKCLQCGKEFKTSLNMLRQCSPECMRGMLDSLTV